MVGTKGSMKVETTLLEETAVFQSMVSLLFFLCKLSS